MLSESSIITIWCENIWNISRVRSREKRQRPCIDFTRCKTHLTAKSNNDLYQLSKVCRLWIVMASDNDVDPRSLDYQNSVKTNRFGFMTWKSMMTSWKVTCACVLCEQLVAGRRPQGDLVNIVTAACWILLSLN